MARHGLPKATKPADDCGCCWAFQEQVTDGLGLAEARATEVMLGSTAFEPLRWKLVVIEV